MIIICIFFIDFESFGRFGGMGGPGGPGRFNNFMGGANSFQGMGGPNNFQSMGFGANRQDPPVEHNLNVTLEDVLHGASKKMKITREVIIQGTNTTRSEPKVLEINVKKGWKEGTKITFPKEGDQRHGIAPADIIFTLRDKQHPLFKRDHENNLIYRHKVSLKRALLGCSVDIPTLDQTQHRIEFKQILPTTKRRLKGYGLPKPKFPNTRADLIVEFDIDFPKNLSDDTKQQIGNILPD